MYTLYKWVAPNDSSNHWKLKIGEYNSLNMCIMEAEIELQSGLTLSDRELDKGEEVWYLEDEREHFVPFPFKIIKHKK